MEALSSIESLALRKTERQRMKEQHQVQVQTVALLQRLQEALP